MNRYCLMKKREVIIVPPVDARPPDRPPADRKDLEPLTGPGKIGEGGKQIHEAKTDGGM